MRRSRRWRRARTRSCATSRPCPARGSRRSGAAARGVTVAVDAVAWDPEEARGWLRSVGRFAGGRIALDGAPLPEECLPHLAEAPLAPPRSGRLCAAAVGRGRRALADRGRHRERVPGGALRDPVRRAARPQRGRARLGRRCPAAGGGGGRRVGTRGAGRMPRPGRRRRAAAGRRAAAAPAPAPAGRGPPASLPQRGAPCADVPGARGRRRALAQPRRARGAGGAGRRPAPADLPAGGGRDVALPVAAARARPGSLRACPALAGAGAALPGAAARRAGPRVLVARGRVRRPLPSPLPAHAGAAAGRRAPGARGAGPAPGDG